MTIEDAEKIHDIMTKLDDCNNFINDSTAVGYDVPEWISDKIFEMVERERNMLEKRIGAL